MYCFDPTWPQHRLHLGSTSANKAPTWAHLAASSAQLGSIIDCLRATSQHGFNMEDMAGPIRNPQNTRFTGISHVCGHRHFVVLNPSGAIALPDPLAHFGDSAAWALKPRTAKFDASRLLVGPSRPASFLSVLCLGSGRLSSRSDSNNFDLD